MINRPWYAFMRCWIKSHEYFLTLIPGVDRYAGRRFKCVYCDKSHFEMERE